MDTQIKNTHTTSKRRKARIICLIIAVALLASGAITLWLTTSASPPEHIQYTTKPMDIALEGIIATRHIDSTIVLDMPAVSLGKVTAKDIGLHGFFEGMEVTDVKADANQVTIAIVGEPLIDTAYDEASLNQDGEISINGRVMDDNDAIYIARVPIIYPKLVPCVQAFNHQDTFDEYISMTLVDDAFKKSPEQGDLMLSGVFEGMQISHITTEDHTLSFHISGEPNADSINGQILLSGDVLQSGLSVQKNFSIIYNRQLFSNTPITIEKPFHDTVSLCILDDAFCETLSPDMFVLGAGLEGAHITDIKYIDSTSVDIIIEGDIIDDTGYGTIELSADALVSGHPISCDIPILSPAIGMQSDDTEIMASDHKRDYMLTIYSTGNDFMKDTLTAEDFTLSGAISSMEIIDVQLVNGHKVDITLQGAPQAGEGSIMIHAEELGDIESATCKLHVVDSISIFGTVNLTDYLPDMTVAFYDKDHQLLDIPSGTTDEFGIYIIPISWDMPHEQIAYVKATKDNLELSAPFEWSDRINFQINAFTTLMARSIEDGDDKAKAIAQVYRLLELEDFCYKGTNYGFIGTSEIFSHKLFEQEADGDVNGFIDQLMAEMQANKTHPFSDTQELSGQTGGILDSVMDWGLEKIKDGVIAGAKVAGKEGSLAMLRKAGILEPSNKQRLKDLQKTINKLSDRVEAMQSKLEYKFEQASVDRKMDQLRQNLSDISRLNSKYIGVRRTIEAEVDAYNKKHPNIELKMADGDTTKKPTSPIVLSELPETTKFFGRGGKVDRANVDHLITNIISNLNGKITITTQDDDGKDIIENVTFGTSLITSYYALLKEELPFEHNAAQELYAFMQNVTCIESLGMQLYGAHCLYVGDASDRATMLSMYENAIDQQCKTKNSSIKVKKYLLPNKKVFKTVTSKGNTRVRLNANGKYYVFHKRYRKMKKGVYLDYDGYYRTNFGWQRHTKQDIKDLFKCRDNHYPKMNSQAYLLKFLPFNKMPGWIYHKTQYTSVPHHAAKGGIRVYMDVIVFDTEDGVYYKLKPKDLIETEKSKGRFADDIMSLLTVSE